MEKKAYDAWMAARVRCKPTGKCSKPDYGQRGIRMCDRWRDSFQSFVNDVGLPSSANLSIDRTNVNGDYEPGNVKWVTDPEQRRNKRNTHWLDIGDGKQTSMADAARLAGVSTGVMFRRWESGWTGAKLLKPVYGSCAERTIDPLTIGEETRTVKEWADSIGMSYFGFRRRMKTGITGAALLQPHMRKRKPKSIDNTSCL